MANVSLQYSWDLLWLRKMVRQDWDSGRSDAYFPMIYNGFIMKDRRDWTFGEGKCTDD